MVDPREFVDDVIRMFSEEGALGEFQGDRYVSPRIDLEKGGISMIFMVHPHLGALAVSFSYQGGSEYRFEVQPLEPNFSGPTGGFAGVPLSDTDTGGFAGKPGRLLTPSKSYDLPYESRLLHLRYLARELGAQFFPRIRTNPSYQSSLRSER